MVDASIHKEFAALEISNVPIFSFRNRCFWCRVVKVYDGDTITGVIKVDGVFYKIPIRLSGVDACELRSKNSSLLSRAISCRERLKQLLGFDDKDTLCMVWVKCLQNDKYGRVLGDVYKSPEDKTRVQDILLEENQVYAYKGGTRKTEDEQEEFFKKINAA